MEFHLLWENNGYICCSVGVGQLSNIIYWSEDLFRNKTQKGVLFLAFPVCLKHCMFNFEKNHLKLFCQAN